MLLRSVHLLLNGSLLICLEVVRQSQTLSSRNRLPHRFPFPRNPTKRPCSVHQNRPPTAPHRNGDRNRPGGVDTDRPTKKKAPFLCVCRPPRHPWQQNRVHIRSFTHSQKLSLPRICPPPFCSVGVPLHRLLLELGFPGGSTEMANKHTIILMQSSPNRATRTFMDYDSIGQAMDGICGLYERKLNDLNPTMRNIQYDIADLYNFIDGLADMSALVFEHSIQAYLPYDRQWIKQRIFNHLKRLANN